VNLGAGRRCGSTCRWPSLNRNTKAFAGFPGCLHPLAVEIAAPILTSSAGQDGRTRSRRLSERVIKYFFGGNAIVAVVVLALITIFLIREGFGFFGQNLRNLRLYRTAGLEYVDIIRAQAEQHSALTRSLNRIRLREFKALTERGLSTERAQAALASFDQFATAFSDAGDELNGLVSDLNDEAMGLKEAMAKRDEAIAERDRLTRTGDILAAGKIAIPAVDAETTLMQLRASAPTFRLTSSTLAGKLSSLLNSVPSLTSPAAQSPRLCSRPSRRLPGTGKLEPGPAGPLVSRHHCVSFRTRLDHRQFLAGLVRHPAIVGWLDYGLRGRAVFRGSVRRRRRDLHK
jgi:hypothetical protein